MKKTIFNCLMITSVVCACFSFFSCNYFNEPIAAYFEKYTSTAAIESHTLSVTTMLDAAGNPCIGSSQDLVITFALRNPQSYTLLLTPELGSVAEENLARSCVQENRNTVRLTVTASDLFELEKNNSEKTTIDISPLIQIQESETLRTFDSYTFPLALNTPPPQVSGAVVCVDTNSNYVVCFTMPSADILKSVHTDIEHLIINNQDIALTVNANGTYTFDVPNDNLITDATNLVYATNTEVSFVPGTNQLYYTTGISQSDSKTTFSLKLRDTSGLISEVVVSSQSEKLEIPTATATVGSTTNKAVSSNSGSPSAVDQNQNDAYGKVTLTVPDKTTNSNPYDKSGATITYAVYTGIPYDTLYATGKSTGNSITLSLPPTGKYRIEATANKSLYVESDSATFYATVSFNDLYVSASGDDTSGHGTKAKPFKTIKHAISEYAVGTDENSKIYLLSDIKESIEIDDSCINLQIIGTDTSNNNVMRTVTGTSGSVFNISTDNTTENDFQVTLKNLKITGGSSVGGGGMHINKTGSGAAECLKVTLDNCVVSGNKATADGGGIYARNAIVTLTNGTVIGNKNATSAPTTSDVNNNGGGNVASLSGGGIYITTGKLNIKPNCYVSGNIVYNSVYTISGGGIMCGNNAFLAIGDEDSSKGKVYIQYNAAVNDSNAGGGGICYAINVAGSSVNNAVIKGNSAKGSGGGVSMYGSGASVTFNGCTLQDNSANSGGGIYLSDSSLNCIVKDSSFKNNSETTADTDICVDDYAETKLHLSGNVQMDDGIYLKGTACSPILIDGELTNTTPIPLSGGKVAEGETVITGTDSHSLTQDDCDKFTISDKPNLMICFDGDGSGVLADRTTIYFANSSVSESGDGTYEKPFKTVQEAVNEVIGVNNGTSAYTIYLTGTFEPEVDNSFTDSAFVNIKSSKKLNLTIAGYNNTTATINANRTDSSSNKARVMNINGTTNDDDNKVTIRLNNLTLTGGYIEGDKGGLYVGPNSTCTMNTCTISGNEANQGNGGGVYVEGGSSFTMNGGTITGNTATDNDGGGGGGGGVYLAGGSVFTMDKEAKISKNTAKYGGGVYVNKAGTFTMTDGTIGGESDDTGNTATNSGGGVYVKDNSKFTMNGGTISYNKAADYYGGGVYAALNSTFTMTDGTITGNTATGENNGNGGGVYVAGSGTFTMSGTSEISGNTALYGGGVCTNSMKSAAFTMNGGTISGNTAAICDSDSTKGGSGGGVYVKDNSTFTMSGTAQITSDNDVYLPTSKVITIGGKLIPPDGVTTVATITLEDYTTDRTVLKLADPIDLSPFTLLADEVGKFALSNSSWSISNEGELQNFANIAFLESAPSSGTTVICNSAAGMNKIATWVNDGSLLSGVTIILTNDIELNDAFEPIGSGYNSDYAFKGTFDGNEHTIRGLDTTNSNISYPALFGCVKGTIKNLTVEGSSNCAGIVGTLLSNGVIDNCVNKVNVTSESKFAAGIVASLNGGTVKNCINEGNITNKHNYCGGIFAHDNMSGSTILNCTNTGETKGSSFVGGIGGFLFCNLYNCVNTGSVTASDRYCGGIIGNCATSTPNAGVFNSYNTGEVKGTSYVGGIVGCADISSSLNYDAYVINCYNSGDVTISSGAATSIGGVVGGIESGGTGTAKIADCYYLQSTATNGVGSTNDISVTTEFFDGDYILNNEARNNLYDKLNEWVTTNNMSGSEYYLTSEPRYKAWPTTEAPEFSE